MSSLPEKIEVMCPKCGEEFADWYLSSADPATSAVCPHCGFDFARDDRIRQEGGWQPEADEVEAIEH
jgi:predicted RNA-binding Zn-ribbon protein involved in translation (DUF1610 family)